MFDPDDVTSVPSFSRERLNDLRSGVDHDRVKRVVARSIERANAEDDDDDVDDDWLAFERGARPLGVVIDDSERGPEPLTPAIHLPGQRQARPESATTHDDQDTTITRSSTKADEHAIASTPSPPLPEIVAAQVELIEWQQEALEIRKQRLVDQCRDSHPPTMLLLEPVLWMRPHARGLGTLIRKWINRWLPQGARRQSSVSP